MRGIVINSWWERFYLMVFCLCAALALSLLALCIIALYLVGHRVLSWQFLTAEWQHRDITKGGIFQAIVGSFGLGVGVMLFSVPLGVSTAIFLTEFRSDNLTRRIIQLAVRNLAGVPSIVYGLFGLAIFVRLLSLGNSLLAASLTLSIMTLPWVITAAVEALEAVPQKFRESSYALGATHWQTIRHVTLPAALPGAITGSILGMARAMGETAPIIMVGATFYMAHLPNSPLDRFMALPYHVYILATQYSSPYAGQYAAATALVLVVLVFILSLGAIILRHWLDKKHEW